MKLAEALILRSDLQKRVEQMKERLYRSAKVQENEPPPEDPKKLLAELSQLIMQLEELIQKINHTNSSVIFAKGKKISDALAERDMLGLKRSVYYDLIQHASVKQDRYSQSEVKFTPTVNISELQKEVDQLSKAYRELDTQIQAVNWITDLIE